MIDTDIPSLIERLRHSMETAVMDNTTTPGTDGHYRHAARLDAMAEAAEALSRQAVEPPAINISHIRAFATCMTWDNWADMQDHILRQVDELSRLSASSLPEEIAGLIDWAHKATTIPCDHKDYPGTVGLVEKLAAALRQMDRDIAVKAKLLTKQAREIEKLTKLADSYRDLAGEQQTKWATRCVTAEARIRELEAERDQWKTASGSGELADLCQEVRARDDAIRAKTIEECWVAINRLIKKDELKEPAHSERNGLVLAANCIHELEAEYARHVDLTPTTIKEWAEAIRGLAQPPEAGDGGKE